MSSHVSSWSSRALRCPWPELLWSRWQPSCRLGCKHFSVVVHGLLQVPDHHCFGFFLSLVILSVWLYSEIIPNRFSLCWFTSSLPCGTDTLSTLLGCSLVSLPNSISTWQPVKQVAAQKMLCEHETQDGELQWSRKKKKKKCHTPGARASKSKQQECDWNEWERKPCQSSDLRFFFFYSPLGCA